MPLLALNARIFWRRTAWVLGLLGVLWFFAIPTRNPLAPRPESQSFHGAAHPGPRHSDNLSAIGYPSGLEDPNVATSLRFIPAWFDATLGITQTYATSSNTQLAVSETIADLSTGLKVRNSYYANTSYTIHLSVAGGEKDTWYTTGIDNNGLTVVERWKLQYPKIAISGIPPTKYLANLEFLRGPCGTIVDMKSDPDGRFVMLLVENGPGQQVVYKIPVTPNAAPELVISGNSVPELNNSTNLERFQHSTLGRIWIVSDANLNKSPSGEILLADTDNDGQFDSIQVESDLVFLYASGGLLTGTYITDTFRGND